LIVVDHRFGEDLECFPLSHLLRTAFASYASKRNPVTRQKGIHANIDRSNAKANTPKYGNVIPILMHADRT